MNYPVKQMIVIRRDLKMRRGKEIAQGAHASIAWLSNRLSVQRDAGYRIPGSISTNDFSRAELEWLGGSFAKVTVQVESEDELMAVYGAALRAGIIVNLITDAGATEFHGVPTKTCLAIGPDYSDKIDTVTKHLKLY